VWTFDNRKVTLKDNRKETREILLWDLAGQPGYRLIHQLHLDEVAVALVVFDAKSETDAFAGVHHWNRALCQAQRLQGESSFPVKKYLVAARSDRGGVGLNRKRISQLKQEMGFDGYFKTSAKEGKGIDRLIEKLQKSIDWKSMPQVSSTKLFQDIKTFLVKEKKAKRILSTIDDLYHAFMKTRKDKKEDLLAEFNTCIGRVEARGLIRRLSFGDLILLQPEMLDSYASAMINAAKDEPDGMGCIHEEDAKEARFYIPEDERIKNKNREKLLLIAMIEDLLNHEIALRQQTDKGPQLVFPSQFTRTNPELPDPKGKAVIFSFEGPLLSVYTTLIVRLAHSGLFVKKEMWKDAALFTATVGGDCGLWLDRKEEGKAELVLFFPDKANEQTQFEFEDYVRAHLLRRALAETVSRRRIFVCPKCDISISDKQAQQRRKLGHTDIKCPVCEKIKINLLDGEERLKTVPPSAVPAMDRAADKQRDLGKAALTIQGKIEIGDFDVFISYNGKDKNMVKEIAERLKERGILPWLDKWELQPGLSWQDALEQQIIRIKSAAILVGKNGVSSWQKRELNAFIDKSANKDCSVIPVLLPDAPEEPKIPIFLKEMQWVDFREKDPDPLEQLIWGITGEREGYLRIKKVIHKPISRGCDRFSC
jgi:hypothetical protein